MSKRQQKTVSIRSKLLGTMIGLLVALIVVQTFIHTRGQTSILQQGLERRLELEREILIERGRTEGENLRRQSENDIAAFNFSNIAEVIRDAVREHEDLEYVILMDRVPVAFVHTGKPELQQEQLVGEDDLFAGEQEVRCIHEYVDGERAVLEFIEPIRVGNERWGVLRLGYSLESLNRDIVTTQNLMREQTRAVVVRSSTIALVFLVFGAGIVTWRAGRLSKPISDLTASARLLAEGDFTATHRFREHSNDEVGLLSQAFVTMAENLEASYSQLGEYNRKLEQMVEERTSELSQMTDEALAAREAAEDANRAKSTFLANMSHELRTPLNAILGYSEMLEEEALDLDQAGLVPDLKKIQTSGKHLLALINDVLDLSKIEAGKISIFVEHVVIADLIEEVMMTIEPLAAQNNNTLSVSVESDVDRISVDLIKVKQCLLNLLSNACKFTFDGKISVRVFREVEDEHSWICMAVADSGIGMTPEQLGRIFHVFAQADSSTTRKYGGTGLGLVISRKFCQLLGGDITVTSESGKGSEFTIRLPQD